MEASKITITKKPVVGPRGRDILQYLHERTLENDRFLQDVDLKSVANGYALARNVPANSSLQAFYTLRHQNILIVNYTKKGRAARCNININYLHPAITDEMRATAPEREKAYYKRISDRLAEAKKENENAYLDGQTQVIVTPSVAQPVDAELQSHEEEPQLDDQQEVAEVAPTSVEESAVTVPVTVKKDGKSISLSVTINLNF